MMYQKNEGGVLGGSAGITLVALVVTIIVLLILAGVSLNLVARQQWHFRTSTKGSGCEQYGENQRRN